MGGGGVAGRRQVLSREDAPVIRLVYLLRRKPELSLADFQQYWREQHAPLVAGFAGVLDIVRYTQSHRLDDESHVQMGKARGGVEEPYDGVAELWWESEDTLTAAMSHESGRVAGAALLADEATFIDLPHSPLFLTHEYPQVNPTPENIVARPKSGIVKLHFPLRHVASLSLEEAQRYWRVQHGPLIRSMAPAMGMLRYMQVHRYTTPLEAALRASRGTVTEAYTGHAEAWFDRLIPRSGHEAAAASRRAVEDESHFIDFARSALWLGKEHVIIDR